MEPLPNVYKAYSMVLSVEKQKGVKNVGNTDFNNPAMNVRGPINIGATSHMCYDLKLFFQYTKPKLNLTNLSDGSTQSIMHIGTVTSSPRITLYNVLHVPCFQQNLLSISKLTQNSQITVQFLSNKCLFQDLVSKTIMAVARMHEGLYVLWILC